MRKIRLLLLFVLFSVSVYADTTIEVYRDGVSKIVSDFSVNTIEEDLVSISAMSPESVIVKGFDKNIKFASINDTILIKPTTKKEKYNLFVQYLSTALTSKKNNEWYFKYENQNPVKIVIPASAKLLEYTEKGIVYYENNGLIIQYDNPASIKLRYVLAPSFDKYDIFKYLFFGLFSILCLLVIYKVGNLIVLRIKKVIPKGKKDILKTLEPKEQEVIKLLLENNNKSYQSQLRKLSGISKATLSRIIKRLENKNLIEVREAGTTNLILLQEWFLKK